MARNGHCRMLSEEQTKQKIREIAQKLCEKRGCKPGHELEDWLEAERMVKNAFSGGNRWQN